MIKTKGHTWATMIIRLREIKNLAGELRFLIGPWFTLTYRVREYAAATNLITPKGIIINFLDTVEHVISIISDRRLVEGGAAILAAHITNHNMDIVGIEIFNPLFINRERELDIE